MKTLIISDLHSEDPFQFIEEQRKQGIEKLVALGDYNDPRILERLLKLDMPKIVLIGNEDYSLARGSSITPSFEDIDFCSYLLLWEQHPEATAFVLDNGRKNNALIAIRKINRRKVAYVHGGLPQPYEQSENKIHSLLWSRLIDFETSDSDEEATFYGHLNIFELMARKNYWLLFRGHDHFSGVFSKSLSNNERTRLEEELTIELQDSKRYVINIGCFRLGAYAIFNSNNNIIELKNFKN